MVARLEGGFFPRSSYINIYIVFTSFQFQVLAQDISLWTSANSYVGRTSRYGNAHVEGRCCQIPGAGSYPFNMVASVYSIATWRLCPNNGGERMAVLPNMISSIILVLIIARVMETKSTGQPDTEKVTFVTRNLHIFLIGHTTPDPFRGTIRVDFSQIGIWSRCHF